jgi:hypothetical protein
MCDTFTQTLIKRGTPNAPLANKPFESSAWSDPYQTISNSSPFERWPRQVPRVMIYPGSPLFDEVIMPRMFQSALESEKTCFTDLKY